MSTDRKKGQLKLEGANPMAFVDSGEPPVDTWAPEEEKLARAVGQAIKNYLKSTEALSAEKYQHLEATIPRYMTAPGNVLVAVCLDGIVIRYEAKVSEERKCAITVFKKPINEVAALLSQNLVHIESVDAPTPENEKFGVEIKLTVHSPADGKSQDVMASRVWFQTKRTTEHHPTPPGGKPYCLLSVRNELALELHGAMSSKGDVATFDQPFVTYSTIRIMAGWDCIEVYPSLDISSWNADFAPLWAEHDILGAAVIAHTREAKLSSLDPRASTRRLYATLLARFKSLLDSNPDREQILHTFLQENPVLLCPTKERMWSKLPLGASVTDFVFRDANKEYLLVELERSTLQLFRQDGHPTADLTHAHGQIVDWKRYLEDNLRTAQIELGLDGITPNPNGLLVIGRSSSLLPKDRRKLQTMANEMPKLRIMTYDDVYENAKAVFENVLGPMWDVGGTTEVFYPQSDD